MLGAANPGRIWALVQGPFPIPAGELIKIVWKMTGDRSTPAMVAMNARGRRVAPATPLGIHLGSTWRRPGEEWGSGWIFPSPGCWDVHATLGVAQGDVWFLVSR